MQHNTDCALTVGPPCGELDADWGLVISRSMTCSRTLRSRIRNTTGEPLTSNRSPLLLLLLLTGDTRDISDDVSAPTLTYFSLAEDDGGNSDTRNCDTLHANILWHSTCKHRPAICLLLNLTEIIQLIQMMKPGHQLLHVYCAPHWATRTNHCQCHNHY